MWSQVLPPVSHWETLREYMGSFCAEQEYLRDLAIRENASMYAERMLGWKEACNKIEFQTRENTRRET